MPSLSFEIGRKITSIMFVWWSIMAKRPFALNIEFTAHRSHCDWVSWNEEHLPIHRVKAHALVKNGRKRRKYWMEIFVDGNIWRKHTIKKNWKWKIGSIFSFLFCPVQTGFARPMFFFKSRLNAISFRIDKCYFGHHKYIEVKHCTTAL